MDDGLRDRAVQTARRAIPAAKNAIPAAKQAVPIAMSTGTSVRRSAEEAAAWAQDAAAQANAWAQEAAAQAKPRLDDAVGEATAWAKPRLDDVRSWAAPRLERSGLAVQETIAPAISAAMVTAAHKLDVTPPRKHRRWVSALAATMMLAAAASAATAIMMRRRPAMAEFIPDDTELDEAPVATAATDQHYAGNGDGGAGPDDELNAEANGARTSRSHKS